MPAKKTTKRKTEAKKESGEKEEKKKTAKKKVQSKSKVKKAPKKASTKKTSSAKKKSSVTKTKHQPKLDKKQKEKIQITISAVESLVTEYAQKPYEPVNPYAENKKKLTVDFDQQLEFKKNRAVLTVMSVFVIMIVGLWMYNFKMVIMKTLRDTPGFGEIAQQSFEQAQSDLSALEPKDVQTDSQAQNEDGEIDKAKKEIADALSGIIIQASTSTQHAPTTTAYISTSTKQQ